MNASTGVAARPPAQRPARAIRRLAVRQIRRGALIVTAVAAGMSALVAIQYQGMVGELDEGALQALIANPAIRVLFGPPVALDDPGGFTVWRTGTPVLVLTAVWIMLATIRITRGEEDAGRWELLLAGPLRSVDAVVRCLVAAAAAAMSISAGVGISLVAAGTDVRGAVVYAVGVLGVTASFAAVGALAAQVMPTRSTATGVSVAVLGAALLIRMLSDGVAALAWTAWLTPFGLLGRAAPFADDRLTPLAVMGAMIAVLVAATVLATRGRDLGGSWVTSTSRRAPRAVGLHSLAGFAIRRSMGSTLGWMVGIGAYFLLIGALIASVLEFLAANPRFTELAAAAGFSGLGSANGFAAALFGLLAIPTGLYASTRLAALVADERARRWTPILAAPIDRRCIIGSEVAVTAAGIVALHGVAAVAMWLGAVSTGGPLRLDAALAGAFNPMPVALLALGAATLAAGLLPSAVVGVGALPVVGGFLLHVLADSVRASDWWAWPSPFRHVASVPDADVNWLATGTLMATAVVLVVIGVIGYQRRDLAS